MIPIPKFILKICLRPIRYFKFKAISLVPEFQLKKFIVGAFSYKAHFRPQISSNDFVDFDKVSAEFFIYISVYT